MHDIFNKKENRDVNTVKKISQFHGIDWIFEFSSEKPEKTNFLSPCHFFRVLKISKTIFFNYKQNVKKE
jgi:hypothetical protein